MTPATRTRRKAARAPALPPEWALFTDDEKALMMALADPDAPVPMTFREFVDAFSLKPYEWHEYASRLADVLQLVADGYYKRVMVFAPPRLGKSFLTAQLFPAYYLYRHPERWVALASHTAELAQTHSRAVKQIYVNATGKLAGNVDAVKHWETGKNGGLWAVGVGGAATGKGCDLAIEDDVVKNAEEAASEVIQMRNEEWQDSVLDTRLEKNAAKIMIQTRWHQKDLAGYALAKEEGDSPEHWHIVCFEAIKEPPGFYKWPPTCTVEPDWRQTGDNVCPARFTDTWLLRQKRSNPYFWNAMYQQNPTPREGGMFKRSWFDIVAAEPLAADIVASARGWDLAATQGGGDYTVGVKMVRARNNVYYITNIVREQLASGARDKVIKQVAIGDRAKATMSGKPHVQVIPQDPGQAGKSQSADLRRLLDGHVVQSRPDTGDKEVRAGPLASAAFAPDEPGSYGRIKLVLSPSWNESFLEELSAFPYGNHDDIVDATSAAYNALTMAAPARTDTDPSRYPVVRR